jgi:hypothetical protein
LSLQLNEYDQENEDAYSSERLEMIKTYISGGDPIILESYQILKDLVNIQKSVNP